MKPQAASWFGESSKACVHSDSILSGGNGLQTAQLREAGGCPKFLLPKIQHPPRDARQCCWAVHKHSAEGISGFVLEDITPKPRNC